MKIKFIIGMFFLFSINSCSDVEKISSCKWKLVECTDCCSGDVLQFELNIKLTNEYYIIYQKDTLGQVVDYNKLFGDLWVIDSCGNKIRYESMGCN